MWGKARFKYKTIYMKKVQKKGHLLKTYHNACGGTEVQLDYEAVPAGQEGSSRGRHQCVGVRGGGEIRLPSFW